ncbi:MAG: hypothetical protein IGR80_13105 [Synechococcales cyanobacterium K44_A2020_017]|nr:hypothetical protein [Synechococcales cyanobacterium K32_A2020_035]MBF2095680.1 hypothetical protein [Synechococcales cyanobacterium K44_A2020_017]
MAKLLATSTSLHIRDGKCLCSTRANCHLDISEGRSLSLNLISEEAIALPLLPTD